MLDINWIRDVQALSEMAKPEIRIHATDMIIPVSAINKKASLENRARKDPLDLAHVASIRKAFDKSMPVPMIVVRKISETEYWIAGGNHRFSGLPTGVMSIKAHVIVCTDIEFEIVSFVLNKLNGLPPIKGESLEKAVDACQRLGMGQKQAAEIFDVNVQSIQDLIKHRSVMAKLQLMPPKVREAMTPSHVKVIGELSKNDNVLRAASVAIANSKATVLEVANLCREARGKSTEGDQVAVFTNYARLNKTEEEKPIPRKIRNSFTKSCQTIKSFKDKKSWQSLEFNADQVQEAKHLAREVIDILSYLCLADG